jgi:hypothetical protein
MITSKPANGPNPGHRLLYRADRVSGKSFFVVQRGMFFCRPKNSLTCSVALDCFRRLGAAWKTAGEAEAGNAGEQPAKE